MINVTEDAIKQIEYLMRSEGKTDWSLRVAAQAGGCSGYMYKLSFAELPNDNDSIFINEGGLSIFIDKKSLPFLDGVVLDYTDGLDGAGFEFQNPNATQSCGCGKSFR